MRKLILMTIIIINVYAWEVTTHRTIDNAGNKATTTRTLTKLTLETNTTSLNVGDKAKLTVVGRYNNNRTKP